MAGKAVVLRLPLVCQTIQQCYCATGHSKRCLLAACELACVGWHTALLRKTATRVIPAPRVCACSCTCPDAAKGNTCKHWLFVVLRVLKLRRDDPRVWQKALLSTELADLLDKDKAACDETAAAGEPCLPPPRLQPAQGRSKDTQRCFLGLILNLKGAADQKGGIVEDDSDSRHVAEITGT